MLGKFVNWLRKRSNASSGNSWLLSNYKTTPSEPAGEENLEIDLSHDGNDVGQSPSQATTVTWLGPQPSGSQQAPPAQKSPSKQQTTPPPTTANQQSVNSKYAQKIDQFNRSQIFVRMANDVTQTANKVGVLNREIARLLIPLSQSMPRLLQYFQQFFRYIEELSQGSQRYNDEIQRSFWASMYDHMQQNEEYVNLPKDTVVALRQKFMALEELMTNLRIDFQSHHLPNPFEGNKLFGAYMQYVKQSLTNVLKMYKMVKNEFNMVLKDQGVSALPSSNPWM